MPKPTDTFPDWSTDDSNNLEPAPGRLAAGWDPNQIPPSAEQNWWQWVTSKWLHYLQGLNAEDLFTAPNYWTGNARWYLVDDVEFNLSADGTGFVVKVPSGAQLELRSKLHLWGYDPADDGTDTPVMIWGKNDQTRVRTYYADKAIIFTANAYLDDADQKWKRLEAGDSYAIVLGGWTSHGIGSSQIRVLRRGADEADGWGFDGWSTGGTGTGTAAGSGPILSGNEAVNAGTAGAGTYTNSWVAIGGGIDLTVYKDPFGRCHFVGGIKNGATNANISTQPLPAYLRPAANRVVTGWSVTDNAAVKITILSTGHIQVAYGGAGNVFFDGLSYV